MDDVAFFCNPEGRITHVGSGAPPAIDGAVVRDATGLHVYPGLIAAQTTLGLTEVGSIGSLKRRVTCEKGCTSASG